MRFETFDSQSYTLWSEFLQGLNLASLWSFLNSESKIWLKFYILIIIATSPPTTSV